jgi:hypothetical protein
MKWIKVYFTQDQYDEWKSGNGKAIGYTESEVIAMRQLEKSGIDCGLKYDKLDHMTKVNPEKVERIEWSSHGVYVGF